MEKDKEKEFKQTRLVIVLIAIIIILVFAIGVLIGERQSSKTNTNNNNQIVDKNRKEESKPEEKEPDKPTKEINEKALVEEARTLIPFDLCGYPYMPLNKKDVEISELKNETKAQMIMSSIGYKKLVPDEDPVIIQPEDYSRYFEDLSFLYKLKENQELSYTYTASVLSYKNGKYQIESYATGCEGANDGATLTFVKHSLADDTLTLQYAYYWTEYDYEEDFYTYYKDENGKEIYDKVIPDENNDYKPMYKGKEVSYDPFDKYDFIFDISNDNLRLVKIVYKEAK